MKENSTAVELDCLNSLIAKRYNGSVSVTSNGQTCQAWTANAPHTHVLNKDEYFPFDASVEDASNYCRDFEEGLGRPWCYTTDPDIRFGYCTFSICAGLSVSCGGLLTNSSGFIVSPMESLSDQDNINADCLWTFKAPDNYVIRYEVVAFETLDEHYCALYQRLYIMTVHVSGVAINLCALYYRYSTHPMGESVSNVMYINFLSDKNLHGTTFNISYRHKPASEKSFSAILNETIGWITAPDSDGDGLYDFYLRCTWFFHTEPNKFGLIVTLQVTKMDIVETRENRSCVGDRLELYDDTGVSVSLCGKETRTFKSRSQQLKLSFISDGVMSASGFNLTYRVEKHIPGCVDHLETGLYTGTVSVTNHGLTCRSWLDILGYNDTDFPFDGSVTAAKNYCRNFARPGNQYTRPGCFTLGPTVSAEFCTYSICHGATLDKNIIRKTNGWLTAPDMDGDGLYDSNVDIWWVLEAEENNVVTFQIAYLDIERSINCANDFLAVFEPGANLFGGHRFCVPQTYSIEGESRLNKLYVVFYTDTVLQFTGFNLTFVHSIAHIRDTSSTLNSTSGWIVSPDIDHNGKYDHNLRCQWFIEYLDDFVVAYQLIYIDIEWSDACSNDVLKIKDGRFVNVYCGTYSKQQTETSQTNAIKVTFVSNLVLSFKGFNMTYSEEKKPASCVRELLKNPYSGYVSMTNNGQSCQLWSAQKPHKHPFNHKNNFPVDGSVEEAANYCRDVQGYGRPWCYTTNPDIETGFCHFAICPGDKIGECGGISENISGVISHPDFDGDGYYDPGADCQWQIRFNQGSVIRYRIMYLRIRASPGCIRDALVMYEKGGKNHNTFCNDLSGFTPGEGESLSNILFVHFYSEYSQSVGKFEIHFRQVDSFVEPCKEMITNSVGFITAPDRDSDGFYDFNINCDWIIEVGNGKSIKFQILSVDIFTTEDECTTDYLFIKEEATQYSKYFAIGPYCGLYTVQPPVYSLSHSIGIRFYADNIWSGSGFHLSYEEADSQNCGGILLRNSGWLTAPDRDLDGLYDNYVMCRWVFQSRYDANIEIDIMFVKISYSADCLEDYLAVYQKNVNQEILCGEYGRQARKQFQGGEVNVVFNSDWKKNWVGFLLLYQKVPYLGASADDGKLRALFAKSSPGWISSEDLDNDGFYDYNRMIMWIITSKEKMHLLLEFQYIDIELDVPKCAHDSLKVFVHATASLTICGSSMKTTLAGSASVAAITFETDYSINRIGFNMTYIQIDATSETCGGYLTAPSGYLDSSGSRAVEDECKWSIMIRDDKVLVLTIKEINLMVSAKCTESYLRVYEEHLDPVSYCGTTPPESIATETNKLFLAFKIQRLIREQEKFTAVYTEATDSKACSSEYACLLSDTRIPKHYLCDNYRDCPHGDDERFCDFRCPASCECFGLMIDCSGKRACDTDMVSISNQTSIQLPSTTRSLDVSTKPRFFHKLKLHAQPLQFITFLNMSFCEIDYLPVNFFAMMRTLRVLDLSYNRLKRLIAEIFVNLANLERLVLDRNSESLVIESYAFHGLDSLRVLNMTGLHISSIRKDAFAFLNLTKFELYYSIIEHVEKRFLGNIRAEAIYFNTSIIEVFHAGMFEGVIELQTFVTDDQKFCCVRPSSVSWENCYPRQDEVIFSCENLIENELLPPLTWSLGLLIVLTNGGSLVYRIKRQQENTKLCYGMLVTHLSLSDLLMGVYLLFITGADTSFRGNYIFYDEYWRGSTWCKIAGCLTAVSSETSILIVTLITIDRFLVVKFPFGNRRLSKNMGFLLLAIIWTMSIFIAVFPVVSEPLFHNEFYSQSGFCLALPITRVRQTGWGYAFGIFIIFNTFLCCGIAFGQWSIYQEITSSTKAMSGSRSKRTKDLRIALNLLLVSVSNLLCWLPVGLIGILAAAGIKINVDVFAWIVAVVLPVNSVINPVLYTINAIVQKRLEKKKQSVTEKKKKETLTHDVMLDTLRLMKQSAGVRPEMLDKAYTALPSMLGQASCKGYDSVPATKGEEARRV